MPSSTLVFTKTDESVTQFRASFEVKQDCQSGDEVEVNVSTPVKQLQHTVSVSFLIFILNAGPLDKLINRLNTD